MRRVLASLILLPLVACGQTNAEFDLRLREMAGTNERGLLGGMGRIPDNTYQLDEETKVLQWRHGADVLAGRPGDLGADGRLSAQPRAPGLHRRVDRGARRHAELPLAGRWLPNGHAGQHAATLSGGRRLFQNAD
jgi:hypothetical protein